VLVLCVFWFFFFFGVFFFFFFFCFFFFFFFFLLVLVISVSIDRQTDRRKLLANLVFFFFLETPQALHGRLDPLISLQADCFMVVPNLANFPP